MKQGLSCRWGSNALWEEPMNQATNPASARGVIGKYRWIICGLLLFSTTVNYMDRQVISYVKEFFCRPADQGGFGWTNSEFANVTAFFTGIYAGATILAGFVIDKIGTKLGLALSLIAWSFFGMANALAGSFVWVHVGIRSFFGLGEAGNFPASIKTVAEWFPKRERALATGIFNSGSNIGAMIAALFVPWCMIQFGDQLGWKMAYLLTGAIGLIWLIFWFWLYDPPSQCKRLSKAEFDYIHGDADEAKAAADSAAARAGKPTKNTFERLVSIHGRIPANAYLGTTVMIIILCSFIYFITRLMGVAGSVGIRIFLTLTALVAFYLSTVLQVKRWHDLGKSAWPVIICLLSMLGAILLLPPIGLYHGGDSQGWLAVAALLPAIALHLFLGTRKGSDGANQFGGAGESGLLGYRQTWSFVAGKFFTDGIWWFYLFWLPDYLHKQFGMDKHQIMLPTFVVYGVAIVGSVYGGSIPMTLMKRGMPVYKARMTAMFIIAIFPLAVLSTQYFGDVARFGTKAAMLAVGTICIGAAAHQAWSANLFTTISDMFPKKTVGSVTGIGTMAGGLGGVIVQKLAGSLTDTFAADPQRAYLIMFVVCSLSYLVAWSCMKALVPRHRPITDL
jgi:nitrate/nitrite transporter NarK